MNQEKENILFVDDESETLLALEEMLEDCGYNLFKANSGQDALRMTLKQAFDLVLLDVQMPGMDGFEVAKLMRGKGATQDIPIIFITAMSKEPEHINREYEVGVENYLFKPIKPDELKQKVGAALKYRRDKKQGQLHETRSLGKEQKDH